MAKERTDLQRTRIFIKHMQLKPKEFEVFRLIFEAYEAEKILTYEHSIENLSAVYNSFDHMTEEEAAVIIERVMNNQKKDLKLLDKYRKEVAKKLGSLAAFRFMQIELQITAVKMTKVLDIPIVE